MKLKNGRVEGSASMKPKEDSFSKCDYDLKFEAALMPAPKLDEPKPKSSKGSKSKKPAAKKPSGSIFDLLPKDTKKSVNKSDDDSDEEEMKEETEEASEPKGEEVSVYDIPMPKDAKDVKYKKLVEMMEYKSDSSVEAVAEYLVENLKKQGWESDDSDLINENTAIIKREKGTAELTIFVKPDGEGSKVNMMSDGLSWEKKTKPESKESEK